MNNQETCFGKQLAALKEEINKRFDAQEKRFGEQLAALEKSFNIRLDGQEKAAAMESRHVDSRFRDANTRFSEFHTRIGDVNSRFSDTTTHIVSIWSRLSRIEVGTRPETSEVRQVRQKAAATGSGGRSAQQQGTNDASSELETDRRQ